MTESIREESLSVLTRDLGTGPIARRAGPSRWEKARVGLLGASLVGLLVEILVGRRLR